MFSRKYPIQAVIALLAAILSAPAANAQSDERGAPLKDDERASMMFDFNLKRLKGHEMLKDVDWNQVMENNGVPKNDEFDITKVDRIFGGIQFPKDPSALQLAPGQDVPVNFFVRYEFADSESASDMINSITEKGSASEEVDGKTYYMPEGGSAPRNLRMQLVNSTTVEMANERYAYLKDRNVISTGLANSWKQLPKDTAFRLCIDVEGNRELVDQLVAMAKSQADSQFGPMIDLVNDLSALSLGIDMESSNIVTLRASANNSEGTQRLSDGLNGILGMAKFAGKGALQQAPIEDAQKQMAGKILDSLKAVTEGNTVRIDIAKPEGFDDMIGGVRGE